MNEAYGNVIHRSTACGNIKPSMWDSKRQTCCLFCFKGKCKTECSQRYAHSNEMNNKVKKDNGRFIKECREYLKRSPNN
eukprot:2570403-Ditylum_brightwellii.AAC.1